VPRNRVSLLGVPLDPVTPQEAVDLLLEFLRSREQHHVMTPNSEMLVEAHRNSAFKSVLNEASLNLPDSIGVKWFARLPARVTGIDTVTALCRVLDEEQSVFLLGAADGVAQRAGEVLKNLNVGLRICGTYAGSPKEEDAEAIIKRINDCQPHLLLVAYGAPQQDLWIHKYLKELPSVRVAMGVGGTFDFLAGVRKRSPKWMQRLGIEWLYRLFKEPKRLGRIWKAVVVFPLLVVLEKVRRIS